MNNAPDSDVEDYLYQRAEKNPDEIIELYTSGDMALKLLLIDAKEKGIIIKKDGMFNYADNLLGATDDAVILFFKVPANKRILDQIKIETYPEYASVSSLESKINEVIPETTADVENKTTKTTKTSKK